MLSWRNVYILSILARFYFATTDSYIHPDEHFQSIQVIAKNLLNYNCPLPWEFESNARSLGPLYLIYSPLIFIIKYFNVTISPLKLWYLYRIYLVTVNWMITDIILYKLLPIKQERLKAILFVSTSYISIVYQLHLFLNSVETPVLLLTLYYIATLRESLELKSKKISNLTLLLLGGFIAFGIFNRITFIAFILGPSYFILKYVFSHWFSLLYLGSGFSIVSLSCILVDTYSFNGNFLSGFVLAPLNNLLYNSSVKNLAKHGLHPWYTHILVNWPMILGPALLFFLGFNFKNKYYKTIPFISVVSGTLLLSIVPHQELRFLMPLTPLAISCLDLTRFEGEKNNKKKKGVFSSKFISAKVLANTFINLWYVFNIIMCILMGIFHQGGVVPAMDYIQKESLSGVQIWWRTYSPPTWMLADTTYSYKYDAITDEKTLLNLQFQDNLLLDVMSLEKHQLVELIQISASPSYPLYLIAPSASFEMELNDPSLKFECIFNHTYHLDMDHLDFQNFDSLKPGLGIYKLISSDQKD